MDVIAETIAIMLDPKTAVSAAIIGDEASELTEFLKHSETSMTGIHSLSKHSYHPVYIDRHVNDIALKELLKEVRDLGYDKIVLHSSNEENIHRILNAVRSCLSTWMVGGWQSSLYLLN
ncbi:uncharacterized protein LOC141901239 [Tubulanus polymorphus]|uniref:uncharacterized protein LOC141901239 n=1 Tax=Tubulanus polymorphus TaxID=672921 RepID=UPI003DA4C472